MENKSNRRSGGKGKAPPKRAAKKRQKPPKTMQDQQRRHEVGASCRRRGSLQNHRCRQSRVLSMQQDRCCRLNAFLVSQIYGRCLRPVSEGGADGRRRRPWTSGRRCAKRASATFCRGHHHGQRNHGQRGGRRRVEEKSDHRSVDVDVVGNAIIPRASTRCRSVVLAVSPSDQSLVVVRKYSRQTPENPIVVSTRQNVSSDASSVDSVVPS